MIENSKGQIFYGVHFYPGVAEYKDHMGQDAYRIFINEDTIRTMSPTFAGKPIFVEHVDGVDQNVDELRKDADGWVVESFFNHADGKTWAKFLVVSERGLRAIQQGFKLSNAYLPKSFGPGGLWNGVSYAKEVTSGEYEHLAIVRNPRYEESRILTPEEFKNYNLEKELELKKLANSKEENKIMKLNFFKRAKVENSADFEGMSVILPKSGKEKTINQLVNEADDAMMMDSKECMANGDHQVMVGEKKMSVNDLLDMHKKMNDELDLLKDKKAADKDGSKSPDIESMDNDEDEMARKKALEMAKNEEAEMASKKEDKKENDESADEMKAEKKENAKEEAAKKDRTHFDALKNARASVSEEVARVDLSMDRVARGKTRYGS